MGNKYKNKTNYESDMDRWKKEEKDLFDQMKRDYEINYGIEDVHHTIRQHIFDLAWSRGEANFDKEYMRLARLIKLSRNCIVGRIKESYHLVPKKTKNDTDRPKLAP